MSGLRDACEQGFEAGAYETELVGEFAVGRFEGVYTLLEAAVFRCGIGVVTHQPGLLRGVLADELFELEFE